MSNYEEWQMKVYGNVATYEGISKGMTGMVLRFPEDDELENNTESLTDRQIELISYQQEKY